MNQRSQDIEQFKQYLNRRAPQRRTAIDYSCDVRQFAAACPKAWRQVTMQDIDAFVDKQYQAGLSGATVKRRVAALKVFFDYLAEEKNDLSWPNPVRFKRQAGKQTKKLPRDLSNEQVAQLWSVISSTRDRAWFGLMLRAGLRVGEVVALQSDDLLSAPSAQQPARLRVTGKGQKERRVLLTAECYTLLQDWLALRPDSPHLTIFLNERGQPLQANGIQWLLRGYGQQIGFNVTPHQLRHTFARQLTEAGMPLTSLSQLLGHSQITTTQIYTAGADPHLAQAYQQAMAQLQATPSTQAPSALPQLPPGVSAEPPEPPALPDLQAWAPELPPALRQVSLDLVQRRLPGWKAQRRRQHTQRLLSALAGFWRWQLNQRPITKATELTLADLTAYQQARTQAGKAPTTINRILDFVMAILHHLEEQQQPVHPSVFRLKPLARPLSIPRHLSEADATTLECFVAQRLNSSDPLIRLENACFFLLAHTGLRASECLDLQLQDLDLPAGRLTVRLGKGQRDRIVYLSETLQLALSLYLAHSPIQPTSSLWLRPDGRPLTSTWLYRCIVALGLAAGQIKVSPHRLRHTLATRLLNTGMDITRIQKLLGHDHLNTTMIYARVLDKTLQADYQQAMTKIEAQLVSNWPIPVTADPSSPNLPQPVELDNFYD
jgi:site-specific recombinase XerD